MVFLKTVQNSLENTCVRVSFLIKLLGIFLLVEYLYIFKAFLDSVLTLFITLSIFFKLFKTETLRVQNLV